MSQDIPESERPSAEEKKQYLLLWKRRFGRPECRRSGPFSREEDGVWLRGESELRRICRDHPRQHAARVQREARELRREVERVAESRELEELVAKLSREHPRWRAAEIQRCAAREVRKAAQAARLRRVWEWKIVKLCPRLDIGGSRRVVPGPDYRRCLSHLEPEELQDEFGR